VYAAAWERPKGLWCEVLACDDREFSIHPARDRAIKSVRACQVARLCGETAKARELLLQSQQALAAMPPGMEPFLLERATHHRNALVLGDAARAPRKLKQMRAEAQAWFRKLAADGYACFAGFGL
jgi:hypothetical protein